MDDKKMEYSDYVDLSIALNSEVSAAIAQSIGENRTVVMEACDCVGYRVLYNGMTLEAEDSVDLEDVVEFWGLTDDGKEWRVDLLKIGDIVSPPIHVRFAMGG